MPDKTIKVGGIEFYADFGKPVAFHGKHSGKELSGIDLDFGVDEEGDIQQIEELFRQEIVQVEDPFVDRSYQATLRRTSYNYQVGSLRRHYRGEVREVDRCPHFEILEIENHQFRVLKYTEEDRDNDGVGRFILLRLSIEELIKLRSLMKPGPVAIRRIGVDEEVLTVRYGSKLYWSQHEDDGETYYKQIVIFLPPDLPPSKLDIASGTEQNALADMVGALSARFEVLINELVQGGVISYDKRAELLKDNWRELLDHARVSEIWWNRMRTSDAEEEFD